MMLMDRQIREVFGAVPTHPEEFVLASQIIQAEANKFFIERMRTGRPLKTGIIWWNLLDGWPQFSDAVVDYYYTKKLAYHYIKCSQAPFALIAGEKNNWNLPIYACNDTLQPKEGHYEVIDAKTDAVLLSGEFKVAANSSSLIASCPLYHADQSCLVLRWKIGDETGLNHYLCAFPPLNLTDYKSILDKYHL